MGYSLSLLRSFTWGRRFYVARETAHQQAKAKAKALAQLSAPAIAGVKIVNPFL